MKVIYRFIILCSSLYTIGSTAQSSDPWQQLPRIETPTFKSDTFNIVSYGAVNDGLTLNTQSIDKAIKECSAKGGGVVWIPAGLWLTGPIELRSNVNFSIDKNATLLFTKDKSQYQLVETSWEGLPAVRNQSPISGTNLENIAITGKGIIDGNGDAWRAVKKDKLNETQWNKLLASGGLLSEDGKTWFPSVQYAVGHKVDKAGVLLNGKTLDDFKEYKDFFRPNLLVLTQCKRVLIDGPTFQNSAAWCLHPLMSEHVTVRNVLVRNPWYAHNGDGLDVESCSNVLVENCVFDVGDDGICIKSGRDESGRKRGKPTQDLIARNCTVYHAHGGFVIGSEMSGGVRNMYVENCTFIGTDIGLRFKTARGRGGIVENVYARNIVMKDIVGEAILFDMYYMAKDPIVLAGEKRAKPKIEALPVTEATPQFKNFHISHVVCDGAEKAVFVRGLPEMNITDLHFDHLVIQAHKGIEITEAQDLHFTSVTIHAEESQPLIDIYNAGHIQIDQLKVGNPAALLFQVGGEKSNSIKVQKVEGAAAKSKVQFVDGAKSKSIEIK